MVSKTLEMRPYQQRITETATAGFLGRLRNKAGDIQINDRSILVESPTGSGKTVIGWSIANQMQREIPDLHIAWYAMRRNLLTQAERENAALGFNVRNVLYMSMFDQDLSRLMRISDEGKKLLLVCDEAQHDAAPTMASHHNHLKPDFTLGLTATPFRTDRVKLCFDRTIRDAGIHQLIQDGYLSRYHHYTIKDWKPQTVAETYLRDPQRWGKSIFYFKDLTECGEMFKLLRASGVLCELVTGESDVETQLELFKNGQINVLVNCMKLTEGFDEPSLQSAFVRDSSRGPTMQMAGRVFRKYPGLAVKNVIQSEKSEHPMLKTALPDMSFLWSQDMWKSMEVNPLMDEISENAMIATVQAFQPLPKFITDRKNKGKRKFR